MNGAPQVQVAAASAGSTPGWGRPAPGPGNPVDRAALCAPLLLAALLVILDNASCWRIPLRELIPWLDAPVVLAAGVFLLMICRIPGRDRPFFFGIVLAALAVYFPLAEFFGRWLPDPVHGISQGFDDWCYQALGDYLFNNHRGRIAGMSFIDEFGAHLQNTRFSTAGLLELLENGLGFKDPPLANFVLNLGCLAVHFSAMLYLGRALFRSSIIAVAGAFLATAGGWISDMLVLGSYDNLVFIALIPALIGVLIRMESSARPSLWLTAGGGLLAGAALETYPEGIPLVGLMLVPLGVFLVYKCSRNRFLRWQYLAVAGLGLGLSSPYLPVFGTFLLHQIQWAQASTLPTAAGNFPGLLNGGRRLPSCLGHGEQWAGGS
jgi:hypothetical protein